MLNDDTKFSKIYITYITNMSFLKFNAYAKFDSVFHTDMKYYKAETDTNTYAHTKTEDTISSFKK